MVRTGLRDKPLRYKRQRELAINPPSNPAGALSFVESAPSCHWLGHLFDLRAPEKLRFGRLQLIYARFSPSGIEPVPFARVLPKKPSPADWELRNRPDKPAELSLEPEDFVGKC